jgi:hypothetical protein
MFNFFKQNATWFSIAFHSFVLFFAMFLSVTGMDVPVWVYGFLLIYLIYSVYSYLSKNKNFKKMFKNIKLKK